MKNNYLIDIIAPGASGGRLYRIRYPSNTSTTCNLYFRLSDWLISTGEMAGFLKNLIHVIFIFAPKRKLKYNLNLSFGLSNVYYRYWNEYKNKKWKILTILPTALFSNIILILWLFYSKLKYLFVHRVATISITWNFF